MAPLANTEASSELIARVRGSQLPAPSQRKRIRDAAGVTLREMAQELGVTPMTVFRWERGSSKPIMSNALAYRKLLDALELAVR
ncbi:MAG: hypothetical protein NVS3B18_01680 [Candidatus Dormibacteria bacterium]